MATEYVSTKVLITVMTYPHPSTNAEHMELVCVAGITEDKQWVRLYPINYRYRPQHQQFHKYQWIEVDLALRGDGNDKRKESRKPHLDSIKICGNPETMKYVREKLVVTNTGESIFGSPTGYTFGST